MVVVVDGLVAVMSLVVAVVLMVSLRDHVGRVFVVGLVLRLAVLVVALD